MAHEKSNLIGCVSFVNTYSLLILLERGYSVVFILLDYQYSVKASAGERARKLIFTAGSLIPQQKAFDQTITYPRGRRSFCYSRSPRARGRSPIAKEMW